MSRKTTILSVILILFFLPIAFVLWVAVVKPNADYLIFEALSAASTPEENYQKGEAAYEAENYDDATRWYLKAAEQGHVRAQYSLGYIYRYGKGAPVNDRIDYDEAIKWYRKAAEQGHVWAQYSLGNIFYTFTSSNVSLQNYKEAFIWFSKAAKQRHAGAQKRLGDMYYYGQSVIENNQKAIRWYRKSAKQGYLEAQASLGDMYYYGQGVTKNYQTAYMWYLLVKASANNAFQLSPIFEWEGNRNRKDAFNKLETKLTPKQKQAARNAATKWLADFEARKRDSQ